jgi:hypothetical protein
MGSTTDPPSIPLPHGEGSRWEWSEYHLRHDTDSDNLSLANCPVVFIPFLKLWSSCVPTIQKLAPERRHDLARIICDLPPLTQPPLPVLDRLAADLRSISIEISQRRSFQDRYASDLLQAAIDVGKGSGEMFHPSPLSSPPRSAYSARFPSSNSSLPRIPAIATPTSPAIELIRETIYATLADVLARTPSLIPLLKSDPPRAYFGAVALAILSVSTASTSSTESNKSNNNVILGVRGVPLSLSDCPAPLRPLMCEFSAIGRDAVHIEEEDTMEAIRLVQEGREGEVAVPRLEQARLLLGLGAGYDVDSSGSNERRSGCAVAFANRVNALTLAMTQLPQFKERQDEVFRVLAGVGLSS